MWSMEEQKKRIAKMTNPIKTCKCGSTNIRILKTTECGKCYQARRRAEKPEEFRARWRKDAMKAYVYAKDRNTDKQGS